MSSRKSQTEAIEHMQRTLDEIKQLTKYKTERVQINTNLQIFIKGVQILQANLVKYLGLHPSLKLTWRQNFNKKIYTS